MAKKESKKSDAKDGKTDGAATGAPDGGAEAVPPPAGAPADAAAPGQAPPTAPITINGQYIKDLSFEAPSAPTIFAAMRENQPDINVDINVNALPLEQTANAYEVILEFRSECKIGDQMGFILELLYAGVFTLNVPEEHLQPFLLVECPRLLFPFARNILADVSRDGGFPPVMLGPVDFAALYQAKLNQLQQEQEQAGAGAGAPAPDPAS